MQIVNGVTFKVWPDSEPRKVRRLERVDRDNKMSRIPLPLALAFALTARLASAQIPQPTDAPRPLTPEQSAAAFKLPEGFRMEVIASEPLIASRPGSAGTSAGEWS